MSNPPDSSSRPSGIRVGAPTCARCGKPVEARYRPFCSQRCSDIDLGAWVTGAYRVPTDETPDSDDTTPPIPKESR